MTLRSQTPLYCLHRGIDGKHDHLNQPLALEDGDVCATHKEIDRQVKARFFERPISEPAPVAEPVALRRVWPTAEPLAPGELAWGGA